MHLYRDSKNKFEYMASYGFRGLIVPVVTAFHDNLSLNLDVISNFAKYLLSSGIRGVLVSGTTGEGMSLSIQERKDLIKAWAEAVQNTKQHLMVQIGGCPLPDVLELARFSEKNGADALLCLPELYYKPKTNQQLIEYLKVVGDAAPNTPLFYYNFPLMTNVTLDVADFLNRSVDQLPTLRGVKFTSSDLNAAQEALNAASGRYTIFLGNNTLISAATMLGFNSFIPATLNLVPELGHQLLEAANSCDLEKAKQLQNTVTRVTKIVGATGSLIPGIKAVMNAFSPIKVGPVRLPLQNLSDNQLAELESALKPYM
ncbi:N-acetylneuraminate lyase-like isoform X2 [Cylas formicarius]|uniref:N-acetylneuraminate lyase-like isoform X2 n=1 Tax=Cylas formicarius TaxID=197179 RepID=UPI002958A0D6|nr:N-acetylneuraminate lyase-like isoform X2 [Cylas formicarius]